MIAPLHREENQWLRNETDKVNPFVGHLEEQQIRQLLDACPAIYRRIVAARLLCSAQAGETLPEFQSFWTTRIHLIYVAPQHFLNFFLLPHGHGSFRPIFGRPDGSWPRSPASRRA